MCNWVSNSHGHAKRSVCLSYKLPGQADSLLVPWVIEMSPLQSEIETSCSSRSPLNCIVPDFSLTSKKEEKRYLNGSWSKISLNVSASSARIS